MSRRFLLPLLFGIFGTAVLLALGTWQLQRLTWKEEIIAEIEERLAAAPVPVPDNARQSEHRYLRVVAEGALLAGELHVYTSFPPHGVGYRVIAPFEIGPGRTVLLDRGFIPIGQKNAERSQGPAVVQGTLHWPRETDRFTADPDPSANIWFARNTELMASALGTEPVMIIADYVDPLSAEVADTAPLAMPVTVNIPNNHLEYVVTWYGLATVWAGMTVYWLWRMRRPADDGPGGVEESA